MLDLDTGITILQASKGIELRFYTYSREKLLCEDLGVACYKCMFSL